MLCTAACIVLCALPHYAKGTDVSYIAYCIATATYFCAMGHCLHLIIVQCVLQFTVGNVTYFVKDAAVSFIFVCCLLPQVLGTLLLHIFI